MEFEFLLVKLVAIGAVSGLAYGVLNLIGGYLKRPAEENERDELVARQSEEIHDLKYRCRMLEDRLDAAERNMLKGQYRPVITPSEGT